MGTLSLLSVFLAVLGVIMAVVSFLMDWGISTCNTSRYSDNQFSRYQVL